MMKKSKYNAKSQSVNKITNIEISMNDNKKFSIREYREALYNDIVKKKK
jgi:mitogen-activated protein kinase 15